MPIHKITKKVYYHDTDAGGVVYYANYLKYTEEARTEFFISRAIDLNKFIRENVMFCVADVNIKYKAPARYADELTVLTKIQKLGNVYIDFWHEIKRNDVLLVESTTRLVCIDANFRPQAIPDNITAKISN